MQTPKNILPLNSKYSKRKRLWKKGPLKALIKKIDLNEDKLVSLKQNKMLSFKTCLKKKWNSC